MDHQARWYAATIPLRDQVIADVGANIGRLSEFFWEASGGTSRVVSIEPLPENVLAIRARIRARGAEGWTVEPCAASGRSGKVGLAVFPTPQGRPNSMVVPRRAQLNVPCRPLSALVPDATVVKLDIEGHEYAVIEEALPRMTQVHSWAVELHMVPGQPLQRALRGFMAEGFRVLTPVRRPDDPEGAWGSEELAPTLDWAAVPATRVHRDGTVFKMLHILATRSPSAT